MGKRRRLLPDENDPLMFSPRSVAYTPERDGDLLAYLLPQIDGGSCMRLFYGLEQFNLLRNEEWIKPGMTHLRFMYNVGRGDAHYLVTEDWKLEGIAANHHEGEAGIFELEGIFNGAPPFEISNLWGPAWERYLEGQEAAERLRLQQLDAQQAINNCLGGENDAN